MIVGVPIRVLHVVGKMDRAGAETLIMNLYRHINRARVQFDFLTHRPEHGDYDAEIEALGGKVYHVRPMTPMHAAAYWRELTMFFKEHRAYAVVHAHIDAMSALPLLAAKRAGIPCRIAHSHNTAFPRDAKYPLRLAARELLDAQATELFSCSVPSAEFLFGRELSRGVEYTLLRNGVELACFRYDEMRRTAARDALGLGNAFALGHIGRFCSQKNHEKLLNIFRSIHTQEANSVLLLAGTGELMERARRQTATLELTDCVRFLGLRDDIPALMQAMDVFVLPSLYEGFPVVGVEAQAAGLPCVFSGDVKPDIKLTEPVAFVPLAAADSVWAQTVLQYRGLPRVDTAAVLAAQGYDIMVQAAWLENFYLTRTDICLRTPEAGVSAGTGNAVQ